MPASFFTNPPVPVIAPLSVMSFVATAVSVFPPRTMSEFTVSVFVFALRFRFPVSVIVAKEIVCASLVELFVMSPPSVMLSPTPLPVRVKAPAEALKVRPATLAWVLLTGVSRSTPPKVSALLKFGSISSPQLALVFQKSSAPPPSQIWFAGARGVSAERARSAPMDCARMAGRFFFMGRVGGKASGWDGGNEAALCRPS